MDQASSCALTFGNVVAVDGAGNPSQASVSGSEVVAVGGETSRVTSGMAVSSGAGVSGGTVGGDGGSTVEGGMTGSGEASTGASRKSSTPQRKRKDQKGRKKQISTATSICPYTFFFIAYLQCIKNYYNLSYHLQYIMMNSLFSSFMIVHIYHMTFPFIWVNY